MNVYVHARTRARARAHTHTPYRCCFDVTRQPVCFAGLDSRVWEANSAFCTLLGYTRLEIAGLSIFSVTLGYQAGDPEPSTHWQQSTASASGLCICIHIYLFLYLDLYLYLLDTPIGNSRLLVPLVCVYAFISISFYI